MNIINNSTIDTVIDFANVKFGMELTSEDIVSQLKALSFSETLKLLSSMKNDEPEAFSEIIDLSAMNEAGYGTQNTATPSRATIRAGNSNVQNRRANNIAQDQNRDAGKGTGYSGVAGARNKTGTGQGANRQPANADPDDVQRAQNADASAENANQSAYNAQEIERLKQLAGAR
jgi:hypothetical protein